MREGEADIIVYLRPLLNSLLCSAQLKNVFLIVTIRPLAEHSSASLLSEEYSLALLLPKLLALLIIKMFDEKTKSRVGF